MPTVFKKPNQDTNPEFKNNLLDEKFQTATVSQNIGSTDSLDNNISSDIPTAVKTNKKRFSIGKFISITLIVISIILLTAGSVLAYRVVNTGQQTFGQGENLSFFDQTKELFGSIVNPNKRAELKGEKDGRTNFLFIGVDVAAGLTDTLMIVSYYYNEKKVVTLSIPRDTTTFDGFETQKINGVYNGAIARNKGKDQTRNDIVGAEAIAGVISKEFGIPIHYWAKINFDGVKQVVDQLGGIEVDVKKDLYDDLYPNDGYAVIKGSPYLRPALSIKAGTQTMNGTLALRYARSRETTSDFDRSERQSIVVQSILQKVKSQGTLENASKITAYLNILGQNMKTSLRIDEMSSLAQILKGVDVKSNFLRIVWATGNGILCTGPNPEISYSITYCGGAIVGKSQVSTAKDKAKNVVQNMLSEAEYAELYQADTVFIGNQSNDTYKASSEFEKLGFENIRVNNTYSKITAAKFNSVEKTTVYILDDKLKNAYDKMSKKPNIVAEIKTELPKDKILPVAFNTAKIIVWVE